MMQSCLLMPLGAPHGHEATSIEANSDMKIRVLCLPNDKIYKISGVEKKHNIYISTQKIRSVNYKMKERYFLCDSSKSYNLRVGDARFHHHLLNDTIKVKIGNSESYKIYNFLMIKDRRIKS